MEKKNNANVKKIVIAVVAVILIVGAVFLTKFFIDKSNSDGGVTNSTPTQDLTETTEPEPKPDYSEYVEQNPETVGWITIPGTQINFPVVQSVDNEYYLSHTFDHKSDKRGAIYMDYRNNAVDLDANTIIYGHNMKNGTMFSSLKNVLNSEWKENEKNRFYKSADKSPRSTRRFHFHSSLSVPKNPLLLPFLLAFGQRFLLPSSFLRVEQLLTFQNIRFPRRFLSLRTSPRKACRKGAYL